MAQVLPEEILKVATEAALEAGQIVKSARKEASFEVKSKADDEIVSSADIASDKKIVSIIQKHFPDHRILSEELYPDPERLTEFESPLWIIDPIDGTANFVFGQPAVGVSIGWLYQGKVQTGIVHMPFLGETFTAIKGKGAFCNDKPIRSRTISNLKEALIATGFPYARDNVELLGERIKKVLHHCRDIRRVGAASVDLCWVACGRQDAYYETVRPWDIAAGLLIAKEAGARDGFLAKNTSKLPDDINGFERLTSGPGIFEVLRDLLAFL